MHIGKIAVAALAFLGGQELAFADTGAPDKSCTKRLDAQPGGGGAVSESDCRCAAAYPNDAAAKAFIVANALSCTTQFQNTVSPGRFPVPAAAMPAANREPKE